MNRASRISSFLLLLLLCVVSLATVAGVPVELQVGIDPERPLTLYQAPQTYRRDARGRPFKSIIIKSKPSFSFAATSDSNSIRDSATGNSSAKTTTTTTSTTISPILSRLNNSRPIKAIVVTSKPFGFGSADSNVIRNRPTTTTTASPLDVKVSPTIPFFSISCTVGSSCSQIISARQTPTAKPTFKPYTAEEINKFKATFGSLFPSATVVLSNANVEVAQTLRDKEKSPQSKTPAAVVETTTSTTSKPAGSLWRVRTTSSSAAKTSATTTPVSIPVTEKPTTLSPFSRWKWPEETVSIENRNHVERQQEQATTSTPAKLSTWTPNLPDDSDSRVVPLRNKDPYWVKPYLFAASGRRTTTTAQRPTTTTTTQRPTTTTTERRSWYSLNGLQSQKQQHRNPPSNNHNYNYHESVQVVTASPVKIVNSRPVKPFYLDNLSHYSWKVNDETNSLSQSSFVDNSLPANKPAEQENRYHEIMTSKGNKISLITGSSTRQKTNRPAPQSYTATLPPEVSVSSHVIGLRVKPKSLDFPFIENVQGVAVETDGEDVNLSELIMRERLPVRPARNLRPRAVRHNRWSHQVQGDEPANHQLAASEWRPVPYLFRT